MKKLELPNQALHSDLLFRALRSGGNAALSGCACSPLRCYVNVKYFFISSLRALPQSEVRYLSFNNIL
jgi:hypothetical protein